MHDGGGIQSNMSNKRHVWGIKIKKLALNIYDINKLDPGIITYLYEYTKWRAEEGCRGGSPGHT